MLNAKKIMMFSSVHVWNDTRIFYKEAMTLADAGFEVDFYAIDNGMEVVKHPGLRVHLLPASTSRLARPLRWRKLYKIAKASDAMYYHIHDPELLLLLPKLRKKKPNAILTYDMHENFPADIETKTWIPALLRKPLKKWILRMEKHTMASCDHIIFAEESYLESYLHVDCTKTTVYNYPIYVEPIQKQLNDSYFTLIYVGSITEDRGIFEMLGLIRDLQEKKPEQYRLKLLGPMTKSLEIKVQEFVDQHQLSQVVEVYGRVPYPEIWQAYGESDLGLCLLHPIPNYLHSMATKLYEYMAASLPILASDFPDWDTFIKKHQSGTVSSPFDREKLLREVEKRAANPDIYAQEGERGRLAYEESYNWEIEAKKMRDTIYKVD
ncbi:glycosyltransferase family 4 protein [Listeria booriae]|uniref:Glycosyltransferase family 4 protein n=1 Tax=Listeria booriae TaxID=1552123 RepID=A0A842B1V4_9LIST|nr:glycosyltransferase [Listeria booriae]MBC1795785.1 glycosyltransferase family 4 protein [Listeria booriae]MBC1813604.1 glycosyltransferase family 4 protein [Listeria booriae]